jgi:hypothetical protein
MITNRGAKAVPSKEGRGDLASKSQRYSAAKKNSNKTKRKSKIVQDVHPTLSDYQPPKKNALPTVYTGMQNE